MSDGDQRQLSAEQEEKLRSTFLQFTHDGREVLDREEFMKMVESNGNLSGESIYHKFEHAEDGSVSIEQYLEGMKNIWRSSSGSGAVSPSNSSSPLHHSARRLPSHSDNSEATLNTSLEILQTQNAYLADQLTIHENQLRAAKESIQQLTEESDLRGRQLKEWIANYHKISANLQERQDELNSTTSELSALKAQYEDVSNQLQQSKSSYQHAEDELATLQERLRRMDEDHSKELLQFRQDAGEKLKEKDRQLHQLKEQVDTLRSQVQDSAQIAQLETTIQLLTEKYERSRSRIEKLLLDATFYEDDNKTLRREVETWKQAANRNTSSSLSTPVSASKASSLKNIKPSTPSTPVAAVTSHSMTRSSSSGLAPLTVSNPLSTTVFSISPGSSPRSLSSSASSNALNGSNAEIPVHAASTSPTSGMTPSNSGTVISRRYSASFSEADPEKAFSRALVPTYTGDRRDRPAELYRDDSDVDPLAGINTRAMIARKGLKPDAEDSPSPASQPNSDGADMKAQIDALKAKLQKLEADLKRERNTRMDTEAENNDLKESINQLNEDLHKKDAKYDELRRTSQQALNSNAITEALSSQLSAERTRSAELQAQLNSINNAFERLQTDHSNCVADREGKEDVPARVNSELQEATKPNGADKENGIAQHEDGMKSLYEETKRNLENTQSELAKTSMLLASAQKELRGTSELRGRVSELENEKEMWDRSNTDWQTQLDREKQRVAQLQQELDELRRLLDTNQKAGDRSEAASATSQENANSSQLQEKLSSVTHTYEEAKERLSSLEQEVSSLKTLLQAVEDELESEREKTRSLQAEVQRQAAEVESMKSANATKEDDSQNRLDDAIEAISRQRASFDRELDDIKSQHEHAIVDLRDRLSTNGANLESAIAKNTTLEREICEIREAHSNELVKIQDEHRSEVDRLQTVLTSAEEEVRSAKAKISSLETELDDLRQLEQTNSNASQQLEATIKELKEKLAAAEAALSSEQLKNASLLNSASEEARNAQSALDSELQALREQLASAEAAAAAHRSEFEDIRSGLVMEAQLATQRMMQAEDALNAERVKLDPLEAELKQTCQERDAQVNETKACRGALEAVQAKHTSLETELNKMLEERNSVLAAEMMAQDRVKQAEQELEIEKERSHLAHLDMNKTREDCDTKLREATQVLDDTDRALRAEREKVALIESELNSLKAQQLETSQKAQEDEVKVVEALKEQVVEKEKEIVKTREEAAQLTASLATATSQVEKLQYQLDHADKYRQQVSNKSKEAVDDMRSQLDNLFAQFQDSAAHASDAEDELEAKKQEIDKLEIEVETLQRDLDTAESALKSRESAFEDELAKMATQLEEAKTQSEEKIKQLESEISTLSKELADMKTEAVNKDYAVQVAFAKTEIERIEQDAAADKTKLEADLRRALARSDEAESTASAAVEEKNKALEQLEMAMAKVSELEEKMSAVSGDLDQLSSLRKSEQASHEQSSAFQKQYSDLQKQYSVLQQSYKQAQTELSETQRQLKYHQNGPNSVSPPLSPRSSEDGDAKVVGLEAKVSELNAQLAASDALNEDIRQKLNQAIADGDKMKATLQQVQHQANEKLDLSQQNSRWMADKEAETALLKGQIEALTAQLEKQSQQAQNGEKPLPNIPVSSQPKKSSSKPLPGAKKSAVAQPQPDAAQVKAKPFKTPLLVTLAPVAILLYIILLLQFFLTSADGLNRWRP